MPSVRIEGATVDTPRAQEMAAGKIAPENKSERGFMNYFSTLRELDAIAGEPGRKKTVIRAGNRLSSHVSVSLGISPRKEV
ncbi:MAG: hypothetical protein RRC34_06620 [Lentisphaeria bacterium]|nr:hypothetical protein [Lentisphaeria bacterium]